MVTGKSHCRNIETSREYVHSQGLAKDVDLSTIFPKGWSLKNDPHSCIAGTQSATSDSSSDIILYCIA